jgi:uncharacterized protein YndB with AHSA1/START domain
MQIDISRQIGAVARVVETREYEGRPASVIQASRSYHTDAADLWDALTNPERIPRWFLPVSGDFRLGGRYQLQGNASGRITGCEPPRFLALTWEFGGKISWVEVRLTPEAKERTRLELEHIAHPDEMWDQYGPGAVGVGWDMALMGLDLFLSTGKPNDGAEFMAWTGSEAGKEFVRGSSEGWGRAAIRAGTDAAAATAAAARTTAFYTGAEVKS